MADSDRTARVIVRCSYALWPGDGVFCGRVSSAVFTHDQMYLVDRNDRVSELRPYRFGMLGRERG